MFLSAILFASTYALIGSCFAYPIYKRQTPATCNTYASGYLILRPEDDASSGPVTYAGIVPNVKHVGIDGTNDSIVVTKNDDGSAVQPQMWDFLQCTNQNGQSPPPGYKPPTSGPSNNLFGIVRPQNATQHCLALESTNESKNGSQNSILDSYCTHVSSQYRTFMYVDYTYGDSADASNLFFADQKTTLVIGSTAHAELQFFTNSAPLDKSAYQLQLLPK